MSRIVLIRIKGISLIFVRRLLKSPNSSAERCMYELYLSNLDISRSR